MKKTLFISIFSLLFLSQTNLLAQTEDTTEPETTEEAPAPETNQQQPMAPNFIRLMHNGAYVAKYEIRYTVDGQEQQIQTGNQTAGYQATFEIPATATNIRLHGWAMTGLVWDPWGEFYNKSIESGDLNKCYRNFGTTLNRGWDNDCK